MKFCPFAQGPSLLRTVDVSPLGVSRNQEKFKNPLTADKYRSQHRPPEALPRDEVAPKYLPNLSEMVFYLIEGDSEPLAESSSKPQRLLAEDPLVPLLLAGD
jgi:hypothetical protein